MYTLLFIVAFVSGVVKQFYKWATKGTCRIFKYAWMDAKTFVQNFEDRDIKKIVNKTDFSLTIPRSNDSGDHKKRKRRGHRGGRKHKKNFNHGGKI